MMWRHSNCILLGHSPPGVPCGSFDGVDVLDSTQRQMHPSPGCQKYALSLSATMQRHIPHHCWQRRQHKRIHMPIFFVGIFARISLYILITSFLIPKIDWGIHGKTELDRPGTNYTLMNCFRHNPPQLSFDHISVVLRPNCDTFDSFSL